MPDQENELAMGNRPGRKTIRLEERQVLRTTSSRKIRFGKTMEQVGKHVGMRWAASLGRCVFYDVFHALCAQGDGYIMAWRRFNLLGTYWFANWVMLQELDAELQPWTRPRVLGPGEDPRLFRFRGRLYVLSWLLDWKARDTRVFLYDISSRRRIPLTLDGGAFRGKNWIPFEYDCELYFLHSLDPLGCLRCDLVTGRCFWVFHNAPELLPRYRWCDGASTIGMRRGGTPGLRVGDQWVMGFGHETAPANSDCSHHVPFLWLLDMSARRVHFFDVENTARQGIVDPTSWHVHGSEIRMVAACSEGMWNFHQRFEAKIYALAGGFAMLSELTGYSLALRPDSF